MSLIVERLVTLEIRNDNLGEERSLQKMSVSAAADFIVTLQWEG